MLENRPSPPASPRRGSILERCKIVALCILAAIVYGIIHDQITAHICLEYFTVFHRPILHNTQSPTLLGLGWGVIATWWVGFGLGVPLALCATEGGLPRITAHELVKPIAILLLCLGIAAALSGTTGYVLARGGVIQPSAEDAEFLPAAHVAPFLADAWTHLASYGFGAPFGIILCIRVLAKRWKRKFIPASIAAGAPTAPSPLPASGKGKSSDDRAPR